jgi:hypothetical protein
MEKEVMLSSNELVKNFVDRFCKLYKSSKGADIGEDLLEEAENAGYHLVMYMNHTGTWSKTVFKKTIRNCKVMYGNTIISNDPIEEKIDFSKLSKYSDNVYITFTHKDELH